MLRSSDNLWLERGRSLCRAGDSQVGPDLVVGSGSYENAHQAPGRTGERSNTLFVREGSFAQRP